MVSSIHLIGLTGGIASGKSTATNYLRQQGITVIDADALYHALLLPDEEGRASEICIAIENEFPGVLTKEGYLDRQELGTRVFADKDALHRLGQLTHPAVAESFSKKIDDFEKQGGRWLIYDVPLLFENELQSMCAHTAIIWVPQEIQQKRLMLRDAISERDAVKKIESQMRLDEKRTYADTVIDNSGSLKETYLQLDKWLALLEKQFGPHSSSL